MSWKLLQGFSITRLIMAKLLSFSDRSKIGHLLRLLGMGHLDMLALVPSFPSNDYNAIFEFNFTYQKGRKTCGGVISSLGLRWI